MAVIFAVVGGGAVIGIATSEPYSDHSDYSNYDNYSDYSDAEERRRRRIEAKEKEVREGIEEVNQYKIQRVNGYLKDKALIGESGEKVSVDAVKQDGYAKINQEESKLIKEATSSVKNEMKEIDAMLAAIDKILEDKRA